MKKCTVVVLGLCGLATAASAQNFSLTIVPSSSTVDTSGGSAVVTATVYGDADVGTHMLGGAFSMISNSPNVQGMTWDPASWSVFNTDGGYAGNGNYNEVNFGQIWPLGGIFPPPPNSALGMAIGTFEITLAGTGVVALNLLQGTPFTLETVDEYNGLNFIDTDGTLSLGTATINLVPTPGVIPLLATGGFHFSRRRR